VDGFSVRAQATLTVLTEPSHASHGVNEPIRSLGGESMCHAATHGVARDKDAPDRKVGSDASNQLDKELHVTALATARRDDVPSAVRLGPYHYGILLFDEAFKARIGTYGSGCVDIAAPAGVQLEEKGTRPLVLVHGVGRVRQQPAALHAIELHALHRDTREARDARVQPPMKRPTQQQQHDRHNGYGDECDHKRVGQFPRLQVTDG
jgi:hypothetical protein